MTVQGASNESISKRQEIHTTQKNYEQCVSISAISEDNKGQITVQCTWKLIHVDVLHITSVRILK